MIFSVALPLLLGLFLLSLAILVFVVEFKILGYAYQKIGVPPRWMLALLLLTLIGSHVNIPIGAVRVQPVATPRPVSVYGRTYVAPPVQQEGMTIIAINVGGALVPVLLSLYLFLRSNVRGRMLLGVAIVAAIVHSLAQIVPGVGIAVPMFVPPLAAALVSVVLALRRAPPVAYVSVSLGALIRGALPHPSRVGVLGPPGVSTGRATPCRA